MLDFARQRFAGVTRADDQDAFLSFGHDFLRPESIAAEANEDAGAEKGEQRKRPVDQQHAARRMHESFMDSQSLADVPQRAQNRSRSRPSDDDPDDIGDPD